VNDGANLKGIRVLGDLYEGAFGRMLLIELESIEAARWLHAIVLEVAETGAWLDLARLEPVQLRNVSRLELRVSGKPPAKHLALIAPGALVWTCTSDEWMTCAALLEPLADGEHGHQYLTEERHDDVLIEVSYSEAHGP
jgi:hypothetical protein